MPGTNTPCEAMTEPGMASRHLVKSQRVEISVHEGVQDGTRYRLRRKDAAVGVATLGLLKITRRTTRRHVPLIADS